MSPTLLLLAHDDYEAREGWSSAPAEFSERAEPRSPVHVLVVDDEPIVRSYVARLLAESGYRVEVAQNGAEALRIALGNRGGFDLVVTDVRMPGIDGWQLGRELRGRWPDLPVLYLSGYDLEQGAPLAAAFLRKPFDPAELLRRVASLLGAA
jgi:CheY-like chemotaxis protein